MEQTDRQTDRHTDTQNDYRNPHVLRTPRVNKNYTSVVKCIHIFNLTHPQNGSLYAVHFLVERGANLTVVDNYGRNAIHYTALVGAV